MHISKTKNSIWVTSRYRCSQDERFPVWELWIEKKRRKKRSLSIVNMKVLFFISLFWLHVVLCSQYWDSSQCVCDHLKETGWLTTAMANRGGATRPNGSNAGNKICQFKLVLLGESAVGKSSLVLRFVKGQFHEFQESTIGGRGFLFLNLCVPV